MATYLTRADLDSAYGHEAVGGLLARVGIGQDSSRLTTAFQATQATIDRHLRGRYSVPFAQLPAELLDIARSIAWWELWRVAQDKPDDVELRYRDAINELRSLAKGTTQLSSDVSRTSSKPVSGSVAVSTRPQVYDGGWEVKYTL